MIKIQKLFIIFCLSLTSLATQAENNFFISAQGTEKLHFFDTNNNSLIAPISLNEPVDWIFHIAGTDTIIALASSMNRLLQFNRKTGNRTHRLPVCDIPKAAVSHRNSDTIWVACGLEKRVLAYYLPNFDLATPVELFATAEYLSLSTLHKTLLASFENSNRIGIINTQDMTLDSYLSMAANVGMAFYSYDETSIWVTQPGINQIRQFDASDFSLLNTINTGEQLKAIDVSPNDQWLAITYEAESDVWVINLSNNSVQKIPLPHEMSWPVFSQDSQQLLLTATDDDDALVIDLNTLQVANSFAIEHNPDSRGKVAYRKDPFLIFENNFEGEQ